jgi:hypothetical protein
MAKILSGVSMALAVVIGSLSAAWEQSIQRLQANSLARVLA